MPRTDRQIAEYIEYYSKVPKKEREWALDNICKTENKTADEIRAIYEQYNGVVSLRKGAAMPDEFKELIRNKIREGMKGSDISEKYGVSGSAIGRLRADMVANCEKIPENRGKSSKKPEPERTEPTEEETELNQQQAEQLHPEAYPGQIYDDEPIVEEDVKVFIPGEQTGTFDAAADSPIDVEKAENENCEKIREKTQETDNKNERIIEVKNEALREEIKRQRENTLKIWNALSEPPVPGDPIPVTHSCFNDEPKKPVPLAKALSDFADSCHNLLFGEQEETKPENGTARACSQPSLWFALRDNLSEFLSGTFGAGTELTGESVEPDTERLVIRFRTADGKAMRCTLRSEGKHDRK